MKRRLTFCLLLLCIVITLPYHLQSQVQPGNGSYSVYLPQRSFANGTTVLPSVHTLTRMKVGTYVPAVVIVKTRATHGVLHNSSTIEGSLANIVLASVGSRSVSSTFQNITSDGIAGAIGLDRVYTVRYSESVDPFDVCLKLMEAPDVEYAIPMEIHQPGFVPNDPDYATKQPWMKTMKLEAAWDISQGASNVVIAIIDSGTDIEHSDLAGQVFINKGEIPGNGIDDDKNGFVDDVNGWDFVGNISMQEAQAGVLRPDGDPKVRFGTINQTNGHGTAVAGCAIAQTNNNRGIASTGFKCTLLPIKAASDNPQIGGILAGYPGIVYAADMGAAIINCSWGGTQNNPLGKDVINYALGKGSLVVTASGNNSLFTDKTQFYPGGYEGVLNVGASSLSDRPSSFTNYGSDVTVYAPGDDIYSTFPNNRYQTFSGTSFSAPLVAGICGLIKAKHPDWTPQMITHQIRSTADLLNGVSSSDRQYYYGRVNAERALKFNASFTSGDRLPGIGVNSVQAGGSGIITNYDPTPVTLELKNYLASASNVKVTITPRSNNAVISGSNTITVPNFNHDQTESLNITVQLKPTFPWYEANLNFIVTIQAGSYVNYAVVNVPVLLSTTNKHTLSPPSEFVSYGILDLASDGQLYASITLFNQAALAYGSLKGSSAIAGVPFSPTAIHGIAGSGVVIGGLEAGKPTIARSTDMSQWSKKEVSSFMGSVAGIHMFNSTTGVAFGDPVGGKLGLARTTDGGYSWQRLNNAPVANTKESALTGVVYGNETGAWFATTSQRIIITKDGGLTWTTSLLPVSGAVIKSVAFTDSKNGVLLYEASGKTWLANTTNGGTWNAQVFDPATLGISAVAVASPGPHHLLIGSNGEVFASDDTGETWNVVLSKAAGPTKYAVARMAPTPLLITAGETVAMLEYRFSGPNGTRIFSVESEFVNYDTLEAGQNRLRSVRISNTGTSDIAIDSIVISPQGATPADAFRITSEPPTVIIADSSIRLPVRMYATTTGSYSATVTVFANAQNGPLTLQLNGYVKRPTSVSESIAGELHAYPNPASSSITLHLPAQATVNIVDIQGLTIQSSGELQPGTHVFQLGNLAVGHYAICVTTPHSIRYIPLTVVR